MEVINMWWAENKIFWLWDGFESRERCQLSILRQQKQQKVKFKIVKIIASTGGAMADRILQVNLSAVSPNISIESNCLSGEINNLLIYFL